MAPFDAQHFWDDRVRCYGERATGYIDERLYRYDDALRWRLFRRHVRLQPGAHALDVGCNHGAWCERLHALGAVVTGVDISAEAIALAKARCGARTITYAVQRAQSLDVPEEGFDVVTSVTALQHIVDADQLILAIGHVARSAKKGGQIFLIESAPIGLRESKLEYKEEWPFELFRREFGRHGCQLVTTRGIDFLGYRAYWAMDLLPWDGLTRRLQSVALGVSRIIDLTLSSTAAIARFSNTKMMLFTKHGR